MLESIVGNFTGFLQHPSVWLFFLLFFVFIFLAYKVINVLIRAAVVAIIAGLFPIFANMFLGTNFPVTIENILWFAMIGVEMFFV